MVCREQIILVSSPLLLRFQENEIDVSYKLFRDWFALIMFRPNPFGLENNAIKERL